MVHGPAKQVVELVDRLPRRRGDHDLDMGAVGGQALHEIETAVPPVQNSWLGRERRVYQPSDGASWPFSMPILVYAGKFGLVLCDIEPECWQGELGVVWVSPLIPHDGVAVASDADIDGTATPFRADRFSDPRFVWMSVGQQRAVGAEQSVRVFVGSSVEHIGDHITAVDQQPQFHVVRPLRFGWIDDRDGQLVEHHDRLGRGPSSG